MKKVLFVLHDTSRTGAPFVLLYFLQWLKKSHPDLNFSVLALKGGSLKEDFQKITTEFIDYSVCEVPEPNFKPNFLERLLRKFRRQTEPINRQEQKILELAAQDFDVIYANTVISIPISTRIKALSENSKLVAHVHEMKTIISLVLPKFQDFIPEIDLFIIPSETAKRDLIQNYDVSDKRIERIYDFSGSMPSKILLKRNSDFIVGGFGTAHWRKGSDLFLQVAQIIKNLYPDHQIKFQWIGAIPREEKSILHADLEKAELTEFVSFDGEQENPDTFISQFDLFLLPSREDPFPLAAIEAGRLAKPIICFEKATGTAEIVQKGGGFVVPYLDTKEMANKVLYYYLNEERLKQDGQRAKELFSEYTSDRMSPLIFKTIKSFF